jgi:hypothetical protein
MRNKIGDFDIKDFDIRFLFITLVLLFFILLSAYIEQKVNDEKNAEIFTVKTQENVILQIKVSPSGRIINCNILKPEKQSETKNENRR